MKKHLCALLLFFVLNNWSLDIKAQTFSSGSLNSPIPDNGTVNLANLTVSGLPSTIDSTFGLESVCLDITHTYDAQVIIYLISPDGKSVEISTNNGAFGQNYTGTCFNATSSDFISSSFSFAPFTGSFRPEGDLSAFNNNQNPNGVWQLYVIDDIADANMGMLNSWSLNFSNSPAKKFNFTSSNLPIVVINTNGKTIGDHSKISGNMGLIYNGPGVRNNVKDAFNNYNGFINVSIHGSSSNFFPKKSYSVETVTDATGVTSSNVGLVDMPADNDWVLNACFNDKSLMRDKVVCELFGLMGNYSTRIRPVEVVINSQYQGVYQLEEKIKQGKTRVPISKIASTDIYGDNITGGYIFSLDRAKVGDNGWFSQYMSNATNDSANYFQIVYPSSKSIVQAQIDYIKGVVDNFENVMMQSDYQNTSSGYSKWIDVYTFIDNFIINEMSKNSDAYRLSTYFYKDRDSKDSRLKMGPVWDFDISCGGSSINGGRDASGWQYLSPEAVNFTPFWWKKFMDDPHFKNELYCHYNQLRLTVLSNGKINEMIDYNAAQLQEAQVRNFMQWPFIGKDVWPNPSPVALSYAEEVSNLKIWYSNRLAWMDANIFGSCNGVSGVEEKSASNKFLLYPNPIASSFSIDFDNTITGELSVDIYNSIGKRVQNINIDAGKQTDNHLNVVSENWASGLYFVSINANNKNYSYKINKY